MSTIQNISRYITRYFRPQFPQPLSSFFLLYVLTNEKDRTWRVPLFTIPAVVRGGKRIERNETKDGIITPRDICGRAEIEIRDEGFRRIAHKARIQSAARRVTCGDIEQSRHPIDSFTQLNKHLFGGGARAYPI